MARVKIARLQPNICTIHPIDIDPNSAPIELNDAIHEICSFDNGSENGVFSDASFAKTLGITPTMLPCEKYNIFAV